jgi:hypothetical protein
MEANINRADPATTLSGWIRSSRCNLNGNCVETNRDASTVSVRDSKAGSAATLAFNQASWATFLAGCRSTC